MKVKIILFCVSLITSIIVDAIEKKEDLSKALIPYQSPDLILDKYKKAPIKKEEPQIIGIMKPSDVTEVIQFKNALSVDNDVRLKELMNEGFNIDQLDAKTLTQFFTHVVNKTNSSLSVIELTQRIKNKDKRLVSIADFIMNQGIAFVYRQDFIQALIENTQKEKISETQKKYQVSLFEGFEKLINNREFRYKGQVNEPMLNSIKNKDLSDFMLQKDRYELENKGSLQKPKPIATSSNQKIQSAKEVKLPADAFDFSENKMIAAWKVYTDKFKQATSSWFARLKAQTSAWFSSIKNWWLRRP